MSVILVTGSRMWGDVYELSSALEWARKEFSPGERPTLRHGACPFRERQDGKRGSADSWAELCAKEAGWEIDACPADWVTTGRRAGFARNIYMIDKPPKPVVCLAFFEPGEENKGTTHCAEMAARSGIPVFTYGTGARTYVKEIPGQQKLIP